MKVKDLVPVVINKVQLYYKAEDGSSPVYENIGEACYLADMPEELLELEVVVVSALRIVDSLLLDIEVVYTGKDYFAEKFEALAQKFAAINEAMTKPGQDHLLLKQRSLKRKHAQRLRRRNRISGNWNRKTGLCIKHCRKSRLMTYINTFFCFKP